MDVSFDDLDRQYGVWRVDDEADMPTGLARLLSHPKTTFYVPWPTGFESLDATTLEEKRWHAFDVIADARSAELALNRQYGGTPAKIFRCKLGAGVVYPRIWRGPFSLQPQADPFASAWRGTIHSARSLFARMKALFAVVEPVGANRSVHGHEIRNALLLACMEVESAWKAVVMANGLRAKEDRFTTHHYVQLLEPMRLDEWSVDMPEFPTVSRRTPFRTWSKKDPSKSLPWFAAYNATKHDRETKLKAATLEHVIDAMAAVFVMGCAQFGAWAPARFCKVHPPLEEEWTNTFQVTNVPRFAPEYEYVPAPWPKRHPRDLIPYFESDEHRALSAKPSTPPLA